MDSAQRATAARPRARSGRHRRTSTVHHARPRCRVPLTVSGEVYNVDPRAGRAGPVRDRARRPLGLPDPLPALARRSSCSRRPACARATSGSTPCSATCRRRHDPRASRHHIKRLNLTLFGQAGNPPQGFIRLPTSCGEHTVGFDAVAYDDQAASGQTTFTPTTAPRCPSPPSSPPRSSRRRATRRSSSRRRSPRRSTRPG